MRDIRFKAKNLCGHWVEGDLCHQLTGGMAILGYKEENGMGLFSGCQTIDPSTVCQFTGLKDKNGKEIWEHDIVKYCTECEVVLGRAGICLRADNGHVTFLSSTRIKGDKLVRWSNLGSKFDRKEER